MAEDEQSDVVVEFAENEDLGRTFRDFLTASGAIAIPREQQCIVYCLHQRYIHYSLPLQIGLFSLLSTERLFLFLHYAQHPRNSISFAFRDRYVDE
ncbi:hypothetical protein KIN20_026890 [Parelaphostrongylus tenuis]|uniref:Uncharacterized protein n=1 Tax=Parelaphostrongylus tenuis TaxID=148309 RepID=A0AAD5WD79_PARTN|nr:hypothetical protein KIN20_026890 [Parelaphostrongylus tenuis]